jgi:hypothetical protein
MVALLGGWDGLGEAGVLGFAFLTMIVVTSGEYTV